MPPMIGTTRKYNPIPKSATTVSPWKISPARMSVSAVSIGCRPTFQRHLITVHEYIIPGKDLANRHLELRRESAAACAGPPASPP